MPNTISPQSAIFDGDDPTWAIAAKQPASVPTETPQRTAPAQSRIAQPLPRRSEPAFVPLEPTSFREAGLREAQIEALILKFLLNSGGNTGREIAQQLALPFGVLEGLLHSMKLEQLITYRGASIIGDFQYELAPRGAERARSHAAQSTYFGSAPVALDKYIESVKAQSVSNEKPRIGDVKRTFQKFVLGERILRQIGEAVNLGKGIFLHGAPGNGKTTIAETVTNIFGQGIWIPRAIHANGEIIRVFDPIRHEVLEYEPQEMDDRDPDARWVYIKRPTIIVGGELRLENLEVTTNAVTGISEAPLQVKANCGTLVIDDLGRQKFSVTALLNRLIIPLERREDMLNLPSGRSFGIPFELMAVFSTNLSPERLIDEAFLRRIPCTIHATDPTEEQFREIFSRVAKQFELTYEEQVLDYLISEHFQNGQRPFRSCQPRDILQQVANSCEFAGTENVVTRKGIDNAIGNCLALTLVTQEKQACSHQCERPRSPNHQP